MALEIAKGRATKMIEMEGEAAHRKEAKRLPAPDHRSMKAAFELKHWELTDKETPAQRWMEKRLDMIEKNDLESRATL